MFTKSEHMVFCCFAIMQNTKCYIVCRKTNYTIVSVRIEEKEVKMNFYIADTHFGHKNCIEFDHRPFTTIEEMDETLIANWNAVVKDTDDVYIIGDFCYRASKSPLWYLKQLHGRKHLIIGNHDNQLLKDEEAMKEFVSVDKMTYLKDGLYTITLCHFPIAEWNRYHRGAWHIHGHIHANVEGVYQFLKDEDRALNAGCMIHNYFPVTIEQLIKNNRDFRKNYRWELYGNHQGLMELKDGKWLFPSKIPGQDRAFIDEGDIHWAFSEWFHTGLMYHYHIEGKQDHEHTFEAVMYAAYKNPESFEIREEERAEYSQQELLYLEKIIKQLKAEREGGNAYNTSH